MQIIECDFDVYVGWPVEVEEVEAYENHNRIRTTQNVNIILLNQNKVQI